MTRLALLVATMVAIGCKGDAKPPPPAEERTRWIAALEDPETFEEAAYALRYLCDATVIPELGRAWQRHGRPVDGIEIMVDLARPRTRTVAAESCTKPLTEDRRASWELVRPFLDEALEALDPSGPITVHEGGATTQPSIDAARVAAAALGEAGFRDSVDLLLAVLARDLPDDNPPAEHLRQTIASVLGELGDRRAIPALAALIRGIDPRTNPQGSSRVSIAARALGNLGDPEALPVLLEALYTWPHLSWSLEEAIVGLGPEVAPAVRKVLRRGDPAIERLLHERELDHACMGSEGCMDLSLREFHAATLLGELHDEEAVPELLKVLAGPVRPSAYRADIDVAEPPAHVAVLHALRRIGSPAAAPAVLAVIADPKQKSRLRAEAARVYGVISPDGAEVHRKTTGLAILARIAGGDGDADLRTACADAYADLADDRADLANLPEVASGRQGEERVVDWRVAAVEVAARCGGDQVCLLATFDADPQALVIRLGRDGWLPSDASTWSVGELRELAAAQIARAILELGRLGADAADQVAPLLAHVVEILEQASWESEHRIRDAAMLALPRIAPRPCPACVSGLERLAAADFGKQVTGAVEAEVDLQLAYFRWAGSR